MKMITYYKRTVDNGHGTQYLEVTDGTITRQWLSGRGHTYTGLGNPELLGKAKSAMRGYGFRKVSETQRQQLLVDSVSQEMM